MIYNNVSSATMRTTFTASCSTLRSTHRYATQTCRKCHTGTLEFFHDTLVNDAYARCVNCGMEYYRTPAFQPL